MNEERIKDFIADDDAITKISKALSSETRWKIIKLLREKKLDVSRIADALEQTEANISAQVKILEKAGLILCKYEPGEHGVRKVSEQSCDNLIIKFMRSDE